MDFEYDLFVIGAGSGGIRLGRTAAALGAKVAIAEQDRVGGTCVIRGCIPKKLLVYASRYSEEVIDAAGYGWQFGPGSFSWETLIERKNREIDRLNDIYLGLLETSGVRLYKGHARVVDAHTVEIGTQRFKARHIAVATGSRPVLPKVPGIEHAMTSNEALELPHLPKRIAIVGGGYIALEFAGIFHGLGAQVDLLFRRPQMLHGFDEDVRETLADEMKKRGVKIHAKVEVVRLDKPHPHEVRLTLSDGSSQVCDTVLYATGRAANTAGLGLEEAGVRRDANGAVIVDALSCSNVASIHAIGDVTHRLQLTPVALYEGAALARTLFGDKPSAPDYANVPSAVFSQPEVATVGLTEAQARAGGAELDIYKSTFKPLRHTLSGRDTKTMMKLVVERGSQRVVGAHMVGHEAAEIIQGIAIAIKMGATKEQFDQTIGIHPTSAEEFVTMRR